MSVETAAARMILDLKPCMVIYKSFKAYSVRSKYYKSRTIKTKQNKNYSTVFKVS